MGVGPQVRKCRWPTCDLCLSYLHGVSRWKVLEKPQKLGTVGSARAKRERFYPSGPLADT